MTPDATVVSFRQPKELERHMRRCLQEHEGQKKLPGSLTCWKTLFVLRHRHLLVVKQFGFDPSYLKDTESELDQDKRSFDVLALRSKVDIKAFWDDVHSAAEIYEPRIGEGWWDYGMRLMFDDPVVLHRKAAQS